MKRLIFAIILAVMLMASNLWATGSCTQTPTAYVDANIVVKFECTGDATNGSVPDTAIATTTMNLLKGKFFLYIVSAYPTAGGTAPDAADIQILQGAYDVLGGKGINLIPATGRQDTYPYSVFMSSWRYWPVTDTITLSVANQSTVGAKFTVELLFGR